jgi:hypothetical protein
VPLNKKPFRESFTFNGLHRPNPAFNGFIHAFNMASNINNLADGHGRRATRRARARYRFHSKTLKGF